MRHRFIPLVVVAASILGALRAASAEPVPAISAAALEGRLQATYQRVHPAVLQIVSTDDKTRFYSVGVTVTAEGHVLTTSLPLGVKLKFHLPDGRQVQGTALGWSREWGIALAKLEGEGPWPHLELRDSATVHAGDSIATLTYTVQEGNIAVHPLLDVERISACAPGLWFMSPDNGKNQWTHIRVAFNLDGQLVGITTLRFGNDGTVFTQASLVRSHWGDLLLGRNLDELRLRRGKEAPQAANAEKARPNSVPKASEERAIAATVQIRKAAGEKGFSGVVVTKDGLVATCAHHFMMPGSKVVVSLPDGRDLAGEVVGISFPSDLGLVQVTEPGPFPFVEMGDSTRVLPGDACIAIGYGPLKALARQPLVRQMTIPESPGGRWSHTLTGDTDQWGGGDCGGGVFDADGRIVAIFIPGSLRPEDHPRIEVLRKQWNDLHMPLEQSSTSDLVGVEKSIQGTAEQARSSIVQVMDDDTCVALGTIVATDGQILTKASLLPPRPMCRLSDGRLLRAEVVKTIRKQDLALLKIEAVDLPTVKWSNSNDSPVGTVVGLAGTGSALGFISHSELSFPAEPGYLWASFKDGDPGAEVEKVSQISQGPQLAKFGPQLLKRGDIVQSIDGHPTRTREEVLALFRKDSKLGAIAGDIVHVIAKRKDMQLELDIPLGPPTWPRSSGQSARCSGFARVYSVATSSAWNKYGGPVLDRDGHALGIAIAGRQSGWTLVLPAAVVQSVLAN